MKRIVILFLFIAFSYSAISVDCETCTGLPGSGTADDPYRIEDIDDLREFMRPETLSCSSCYWDAHIILMADIDWFDACESLATPIGDMYTPFTGTFDGNSYTISNLRYGTYDYTGFFGLIGTTGFVHDLTLKNLSVLQAGDNIPNNGPTQDYIGGIAGANFGKIHSCYVDGSMYGYSFVGGAVGANLGEILNTHADCRVYGAEAVGGFVGSNGYIQQDRDQIPNKPTVEVNKLIKNCSAKGNVTGYSLVDDPPNNILNGNSYQGEGIGGFAGINSKVDPNDAFNEIAQNGSYDCSESEYEIIECYCTGNVEGLGPVGGFVGANVCEHIESCYSTGNAMGYQYVGGFVGGAVSDGSIDYSYAYGSASGNSDFGGFTGINYGNGYTCDFWNTSVNSTAVGYSVTTPDPPSGLSGLSQSEFADMSNFTCMTDDRPGVWTRGNVSPILNGTTVPTLTEWAVIIFIGLLAGVGGWFVWRRMI